jgi:hypothetical protein
MEYLTTSAATIGDISNSFTAGIAALALIVAGLQLRAGFKISREAGALQAYREYLRLCFEYPQFTSYFLFTNHHPNVEISSIATELTEASEKYLWFLSILLSTCEQVVSYVSAENEWRETLVVQLRFHAGTLEVVWPKWQRNYVQSVRSLVTVAIDTKNN